MTTNVEQRVTASTPWRVVVCVTGSISAYKAPMIVRRLREQGAEVRVIATPSALQFIGKAALAAASGSPVITGLFDDPAAVEHVEIARTADLIVVAPASADTLARIRIGRADDMLGATILTATCPIIMAPAMHTQMWLNAATQDNVTVLRQRGIDIIEPASGSLTSGDTGVGRLPEPEAIVAHCLTYSPAAQATHNDLADAHILISAGGTHEPIDPVRFVGNASSGRQGVALAQAALSRGARVTLVSANISADVLAPLEGNPNLTILPVITAMEMYNVVRDAGVHADAIIMAAAVADYRPVTVEESKIKKDHSESGGKGLTITMMENPDILASLVSNPVRENQVIMGFAAETGDDTGSVLEHGAAKARRKGATFLAVNPVGDGQGFGNVPNHVTVLNSSGEQMLVTHGSKLDVAQDLIALITNSLREER
ncbi:bifunctional phosphopantothenoylcysteine decarboxylase/phosphopantothenate--cysteine ligase CoaBC [Actinomyces vulturis]|uniref:bifunctional phosphopantothenoylcysteine decarboxylase/phosphopantothenate--cysteine ligase CoaBC n=1 Tax=Actinomyces vulturis TaxID=1857645 RepID=UPI00082D5FC0|nr:bifunctional phosphopantothenoylcysteine decarboxylase/phosphopantothenate--cysteine ligase CoaBC [Actinomyces vulturis]